MDVKYRDWINKQDFRTKPCDGDQDEESHYKEKIAAIFEKLVEFAEPVILDEHGELPVFLHLSWAIFKETLLEMQNDLKLNVIEKLHNNILCL